jgi:membrane-bound inhibitor of C-type lysozyme
MSFKRKALRQALYKKVKIAEPAEGSNRATRRLSKKNFFKSLFNECKEKDLTVRDITLSDKQIAKAEADDKTIYLG